VAVQGYLLFVAEEVRRYLAALGLRTFAEAVGRADLLRRRETNERRSSSLDLRRLTDARPGGFTGEAQPCADGGELGQRLAGDAAAALEEHRLVELR
jgi:glutamate synthase (NADPH/NADH) large chain